MSKNIITGTLAAFACAAVVSAQAPQTPQPPATPSQPPAPTQRAPEARSAPADSLTFVGCVERTGTSACPERDTGYGRTTGATRGAEGSAFILTKAMKSTGAAASSPASPNATSAASAAPTASYRLDADDSKLTAHVGHKVEIMGTLADSSTAAPKAGESPRLKVDSVKMIAAKCDN